MTRSRFDPGQGQFPPTEGGPVVSHVESVGKRDSRTGCSQAKRAALDHPTDSPRPIQHGTPKPWFSRAANHLLDALPGDRTRAEPGRTTRNLDAAPRGDSQRDR